MSGGRRREGYSPGAEAEGKGGECEGAARQGGVAVAGEGGGGEGMCG